MRTSSQNLVWGQIQVSLRGQDHSTWPGPGFRWNLGHSWLAGQAKTLLLLMEWILVPSIVLIRCHLIKCCFSQVLFKIAHVVLQVEFSDLWPSISELREHFQNSGIQHTVLRDVAVLDLCKLAITCGPIRLLRCLIELELVRKYTYFPSAVCLWNDPPEEAIRTKNPPSPPTSPTSPPVLQILCWGLAAKWQSHWNPQSSLSSGVIFGFDFSCFVQLSIQSPCSIPTLLLGRRAALGGSGSEGQFPCLPALFPITMPHSPPWAHSYIRWLWECWTVSLPASSLPPHHSPLSLSSLGSLYSGWLWEWWTVPLPASGIECLSLAICSHPNVWLLLFFWVVCPLFKKLYSI